MSSIRVLIIDDHEMITDSLALLLSRIAGVEVVGTLTDSRQGVAFLESTPVDVLITDAQMPYLSGSELTQEVVERFPAVQVLVLSVSEEPETIRAAFRAGVSGYVMKRAGRAELERAIQTVAKGEKYYSDSVLARLVALSSTDLKQQETTVAPSVLTEREIEIVRLVSEELSTNAIAERLFISPGTVETHRHNILRKLGVKSSIGLIKYALRYGLV
jgi:DNA-binding NarL/FixJ family response regulator